MTEYPDWTPEKWVPVLLERTAQLMDRTEMLWRLVKHDPHYKSLSDDVQDEIEDKYFTYHCGTAFQWARQEAVKRGTVEEFDRKAAQQRDERESLVKDMVFHGSHTVDGQVEELPPWKAADEVREPVVFTKEGPVPFSAAPHLIRATLAEARVKKLEELVHLLLDPYARPERISQLRKELEV